MGSIKEILTISFLGNTIQDYLVCLGIFFISFSLLQIIERILLGQLQKLAQKTKTTIDDFLVKVIRTFGVPLAYLAAFYVSINTLTLASGISRAVDVISFAILTVFLARLIVAFMNYGAELYLKKTTKNESMQSSFRGMLRITKIIVWGLAIVLVLDNMGFKISAVIAGLGIGGIAVALAAQAVLGDLFSYFSILFDRPFEVGDFIIIGDHLGVVEHVGIKTTRITSLWGEQLIFSNTDLTNSRVKNYKRMKQRRVMFKLGVVYDTPLQKLKEIPQVIEKIIKGIPDATFDRAHFFEYGDFNLVFEVVYYVAGPDYNTYMNVQQEINFQIKEAFENLEVEFAFPTQTLHVNKIS